jgi:hypothetical protein
MRKSTVLIFEVTTNNSDTPFDLPNGHDSLVKVNESKLMGELFCLLLHPQARLVINRHGVNSLPMEFLCMLLLLR